jgi:hypothetical protein
VAHTHSSLCRRERSPQHTVMKIIVAVKQVPVRDSVIRIDLAGKWIEEQDLSFEINEPDAYALEEALLLREKHGGEVVELCAGPARAGQIIREALAKGADRATYIQCDDLVSLHTLALAGRLAALRHPHGYQEGKDQGGPPHHSGRNSGVETSHRRAASHVGDHFEVVPDLTAAVRKAKGA